MSLAQRRWKWVKFENLPDEMKQYIRPPKPEKKEKAKDDPEKKAKKAEVKEEVIQIEEDKDLDFTKMENVEKILTKFKNQQTSRKNFSVDNHIEVLDIILKA